MCPIASLHRSDRTILQIEPKEINQFDSNFLLTVNKHRSNKMHAVMTQFGLIVLFILIIDYLLFTIIGVITYLLFVGYNRLFVTALPRR